MLFKNTGIIYEPEKDGNLHVRNYLEDPRFEGIHPFEKKIWR